MTKKQLIHKQSEMLSKLADRIGEDNLNEVFELLELECLITKK